MHPQAKAKLVWAYGRSTPPLIRPGYYDGIPRNWDLSRPKGRRTSLDFSVELIGGPDLSLLAPVPPGQSIDPPPQGYEPSDGVVLFAHFNMGRATGVFRPGGQSKYVRALNAVFRGEPPASPHPDCLINQLVRCVVVTVTEDINGVAFDRSSYYSTILTFDGSGTGDASSLPF